MLSTELTRSNSTFSFFDSTEIESMTRRSTLLSKGRRNAFYFLLLFFSLSVVYLRRVALTRSNSRVVLRLYASRRVPSEYTKEKLRDYLCIYGRRRRRVLQTIEISHDFVRGSSPIRGRSVNISSKLLSPPLPPSLPLSLPLSAYPFRYMFVRDVPIFFALGEKIRRRGDLKIATDSTKVTRNVRRLRPLIFPSNY